ncbi:MAG TPA: class I SAM-dependent methyltransferase [Chloroflexia bacterium]|nr:class I SAM-dependent methyltransferase [Chloroflexia bacterium]
MHDKDRLLAHYYDLEYRDFTEDLDFYVQYALHLDPTRELPLLELGCGTGRVAFALAEPGFRVVGVDASEGMLAICAENAKERGVSEQLRLVRTDVRDLSSVDGGPFNMAVCALNTFAYLTSTEDQLKMLRAIHPLLVQHGILIIDLTPPVAHLLPPQDGELVHQGSFDAGEEGTLHKLVSGNAHPSTQTHSVTIFYDLEGTNGTLSRMTQSLTLRWTGRYEMELLLQAAGYRVEKVYGDYELGEYGDGSERMIFVART